MDLYIKFMSTMAVGMLGAGLVLKVLLDELFLEWDAVAEAQTWFKTVSEHKGFFARLERAEDAMMEAEKSRAVTVNTRLLDERRQQLNQLSAVEKRLGSNVKITLTPLPRTPVDTLKGSSSDAVTAQP